MVALGQQGYRFHKLRRTFSKFYRRNGDLVLKYNSTMKTLMHNGITHTQFYGDVVYKLRKINGIRSFPVQFQKSSGNTLIEDTIP